MKLSTQVRYAVRALTELALRGAWKTPSGDRDPVPLSVVARRQHIDERYLRQIFMKLKKAGLVEATQGRMGGYLIARAPDKVTTYDVVMAMGESLGPVFCAGKPSKCKRSKDCPTFPLWSRLAEQIKQTLTLTSIEQLARRCPRRGAEAMARGHVFDI
jgi:Rrf2 family iron-sulfur cluster assembly transcriptional regulator